jgi:DNA-binding NarL/FixJ family response regulator
VRVGVHADYALMASALRSILEAEPGLEVVTLPNVEQAEDGLPAEVDVLIAAGSSELFLVEGGDEGSGGGLPALLLLSDDLPTIRAALRRPWAAWGLLPPEAAEEEIRDALRALGHGLSVGPPGLLRDALAPRGDAVASSGDALAPQADAFASLGDALAPRTDAVASSGDALAPRTHIRPQGTPAPLGQGRDGPQPLTPREEQVLQMLAQGLANKEIAAELSISDHTVKFHISSIYDKLGVTNRVEAVRAGVRLGLLSV